MYYSLPLRTACLPIHPHAPRPADLLPVLGESSMVITEGEQWRQQREAFNPGFSSTFLRAALPGFQVGAAACWFGCRSCKAAGWPATCLHAAVVCLLPCAQPQ